MRTRRLIGGSAIALVTAAGVVAPAAFADPPPPADSSLWAPLADRVLGIDRAVPNGAAYYDGPGSADSIDIGYAPAGPGSTPHLGRAYYHVPLPPAPGAVATDAVLTIRQRSTRTCTPSPLQIQLAADFSASTTWNTRPAATASVATVTPAPNAAGCANGPSLLQVNIGFFVTRALAQGAAGLTFLVRVAPEYDSDVNSGRALEAGAGFNLTYVYPPAPPTELSPSAQSGRPYANANYLRFHAAPSNPGVRTPSVIEFDVRASTQGRVGANVASYQASTFGAGSVDWAPAEVLPDGPYFWRARTVVRTLASAWSPWQSVTLDSASPAAPTTTLNPSGDATHPIRAGLPLTVTLDSPSPDIGFYSLSIAGGPPLLGAGADPCTLSGSDYWYACPSTPGAAVSITFTPTQPGFLSLTVAAFDRAGNSSAVDPRIQIAVLPAAH